jgi:hypothetical protein
VAESARTEWIAKTARAQADFTRELANIYGAMIRDFLKKE